MQAVAIIGCPGSGKTTLAGVMADRLRLHHIELDGLYHGPDWTPAEHGEFRAALDARIRAARDGWVSCGNYLDALDERHLTAADTVLWLDLPRRVVMRRVIRRTLARAARREELWNGNREPLTNFYRWDPEHNIVRWTWVEHPRYRARYAAAVADGRWAHADVHRLASQAAVDEFVRELPAARA